MKDRFFPVSQEFFINIIVPIIHARYKRPGRPPKVEHYHFFCGVLYILRTGISWRDVPACFGPWSTLYMRFKRWSENGLFKSLLDQLQQLKPANTDMVWIDSTTIAVHRHGGGSLKKRRAKLSALEKARMKH